jgi:hypothetical protein
MSALQLTTSEINEWIMHNYSTGALLESEESTPLRNNLEREYESSDSRGYKVIQTVGDGDCLVHAFLHSMSSAYRRISYRNRGTIGQRFRREYIAPRVDDEEDRLFFEGTRYLEDNHILILGNIFHVNFIIFNEVPRGGRANLPRNARNNITFLDVEDGMSWILLHNKLSSHRGADHYSSVMKPDGSFIIEDYGTGKRLGLSLSGQTDAKPVCDYTDGEIVIYNGAAYTVTERKFNDADPPTCSHLTLTLLETNEVKKNIPIRNIEKLSGGGGGSSKRKHTHKRKHTTRRLKKLIRRCLTHSKRMKR